MAGMTEKPYMPDPLGQFDAERAAALVDSVGEGATRKEFMAGMTRPYMPDLLSQIEKEKKLYEKQYMPDPLGQFEAERAALEESAQAELDPTSMSRKARRDRQKEIAQARPSEAPKGRGQSRSGRNVRNIPNVPIVDLEGVEAFEEGQEAIDAIAASSLRKSQEIDPSRSETTATTTTTEGATTTAPPATRSGDQGVAVTSGDSVYDLMREIAGTKEEAKREAFANAMIQLGAGVASGNLAAGLSAAGKAASETMSGYRDRALKGRMAELQLKRADEQAAYRRRQEGFYAGQEERRRTAEAQKAYARRKTELQGEVIKQLALRGEYTKEDLTAAMTRAERNLIADIARSYAVPESSIGAISVEEEGDAGEETSLPPPNNRFELTETRPAQ